MFLEILFSSSNLPIKPCDDLYNSLAGIVLQYPLLLMEGILHHLGCLKPCEYWDKLPTSNGFLMIPFLTVKDASEVASGPFSSVPQISMVMDVWIVRNLRIF